MVKRKKLFIKVLCLLFLFLFLAISFTYSFEDQKEEKRINNFLSTDKTVLTKNNYIAVIEIPKIKLKKGFYAYGNPKNNVNQNIQVIETSTMPDVKCGNLILASHSGTSKIAYFKNLYKLEKGDIAYVYFNDIQYTYQLLYIYSEKKDGQISIRREKNQTNLTLITCDKKDDSLQNIYIFKQLS